MRHTGSLRIENLSITVSGKTVVRNVNLNIGQKELHVVMGPNGSGKSSLLFGIAGHPNYQVKSQNSKVKSSIKLNSIEITDKAPEERAKLGLFLAFQNPISIPGVSISNLLKTATKEITGKVVKALDFHESLHNAAEKFTINDDLLKRGINDGFSGGEKKKAEMLQLLTLQPKYALLDEIDTGLDVDALKNIAKSIMTLEKRGVGILLITHYQRILKYIDVDRVHVMKKGSIVKSGGKDLALLIEKTGYATV